MSLHIAPFLSILLYVIATGLFLVDGRRQKLRDEKLFCLRAAKLTLSLGLLLHLIFLWSLRSAPDPMWPAMARTLGNVSAGLVALYLCVDRVRPLGSLGAIVAPLGVLFFLWAGVAFHLDQPVRPAPPGALLSTHIAAAIGANVVFGLSFCVGIGILLQDYSLRKKTFPRMIRLLPSLTALDRLHSQLLVTGLIAMVVGILTGLVFAVGSGTPFLESDPRLLWSFFLLFLYSLTVILRFARGVRGKRGAVLSILAYLLLLGSFFGVAGGGRSFHLY